MPEKPDQAKKQGELPDRFSIDLNEVEKDPRNVERRKKDPKAPMVIFPEMIKEVPKATPAKPAPKAAAPKAPAIPKVIVPPVGLPAAGGLSPGVDAIHRLAIGQGWSAAQLKRRPLPRVK